MENKETDAVEIDLMELVRVLWSKAFIIVLVAMLCAIAVFTVEELFITPQFTSVTKMLVLARQNDGTLSSGDMSTSSSLTKDYVELIKTREVTEETIRQLGLTVDGKPMTHEQLLGKIDVEQIENTRIITIKVSDPNSELARQIADTIRELAAAHIKRVTDTEAVNVADYANLPKNPSSPHKSRDSVIGAVVGFVLACTVILIIHVSDNTIKNSDDVERYLKVSTLGTIPMNEDDRKRRGMR